ncbi:hypothetical protein D3C72_1206950 [compost metagenome]
MFQTINISGDIIPLLLQRILQNGVAFKAFALLVDLRIEQRLLGQQQRLLSRAQRPLAERGAIQAVADLLELLRGRVHGILHALRLGLQRDQLAVVSGEIALPGLQVIEHLSHAGFKLAQRERGQGFAGFVVVIDVAQGIQRGGRLPHFFRRFSHFLTQLGGFGFDALNFIKGFERLGQIGLNQFFLRGQLFLFVQRIQLRLNIRTRRPVAVILSASVNGRSRSEEKKHGEDQDKNRVLRASVVQHSDEFDVRNDRE